MWACEQRGLVWVVRPIAAPAALLGQTDSWRELDQIISRQPAGFWVIDLARETICTSDALTVIVGSLRQLQNSGGHMCFVHVQPGVANVLRSMRLARLIPMHDDLTMAINEMAQKKTAAHH